MSNIDDKFLEFYINTHPAPVPQPIMKANSKTEIKYQNAIVRRCEFCNNALPKRVKVHKNICQDPAERKFCSRECKENWCYEKQ